MRKITIFSDYDVRQTVSEEWNSENTGILRRVLHLPGEHYCFREIILDDANLLESTHELDLREARLYINDVRMGRGSLLLICHGHSYDCVVCGY